VNAHCSELSRGAAEASRCSVSNADKVINRVSHSCPTRMPMRSADVANAVHPWYPRHLLFRVVQMRLRLAKVHDMEQDMQYIIVKRVACNCKHSLVTCDCELITCAVHGYKRKPNNNLSELCIALIVTFVEGSNITCSTTGGYREQVRGCTVCKPYGAQSLPTSISHR
jgi:hypothetical protein